MRQQHGTGRHIPPGVTTFPAVTADTTTATPRHTYPPPSQRLGTLRLRRALPRCYDKPPLRRNSPAPFKTLPNSHTPVPHRPDTLKHPACTGPQRSNSPPQLAHAIQDTPQQPHAGPPLSRHLETLRLHKAPPRRRAQKNPALRAGPIHLSVIFSEKGRLHLAQTNALTQHNQSGAYPLINSCSHN